MPDYTVTQATSALHPPITVKTAANQMAVLRRAWYSKLGESATVGVIERAQVQRANGAGVTPTSRTEKFNTRSPTNSAGGNQWGTAPTVTGNPIVFSDVGDKPCHINSWRPPRPWAGIYLIDADEVGIDSAGSAANTSTQSALAWSENDPGMEDRFIRGRRPIRNGLWHWWSSSTGPVHAGTLPLQRKSQNWVQYLGRRAQRTFGNTLLGAGGGGGGGATTNQALAASVTVNAGISKSISKSIVASVTCNAAVVKSVAKLLAATVVSSATMTKTVSKSLAATVTVNAAIKRTVNKLIAATVTITAVIVPGALHLLSLLASVTVNTTMVRSTSKSLAATVTTNAAISRTINKLVAATVTVNAAVQKLISKQMVATVTVSPVLSAIKSVIVNLTATVSVNAAMSRVTSKRIVATVTVTAAMSRLINKLLAATVTVQGNIARARTVFLTLAATVAVTAAMTTTFHAFSAVVRRGRMIILNRFGVY